MNESASARLGPRRLITALTALLVVALAVACGGGGGVGSGGTGAPLSRSSGTGTVTGFGSLVLDGVRYDDQAAPVVAETAPGVTANAALTLGDSVEVEIGDDGAIASVAVEARLVAPIESIGPGGFTALGQTVRVNADGNAGPVTLYSAPLTGLASLAAGDIVEVHGIARTGAGADVLQATRIERRAAAPAQWRLAGRIHGLQGSGAAQRFSLGSLTVESGNAALRPAGVALADGQTVLVFGNSVAGDPSRLAATQVRVYERLSTPAVDAQIGGVVDALDGTGFRVNGIRVETGSALITPASRTLANEAYVQVRGAYRSSDGVLVASRIKIRHRADEPEVELSGNVFEVDAASSTLRLRGTRVATAAAQLQGCPVGLADGGYVELTGSVDGTGVVADRIRCRNEPAGATIERRGVAGPADTVSSTFTLARTRRRRPLTVRFDQHTFFGGVDASNLSGAAVRVEGRFNGGVLEARAVVAL